MEKKYEEKVEYGHTEAKQENKPLLLVRALTYITWNTVSMDNQEHSNPPKTQRLYRKTSNQN